MLVYYYISNIFVSNFKTGDTMKQFILILAIAFSIVSCKNEKTDTAVEASTAPAESTEAMAEMPATDAPAVPTGPITKIGFAETDFDFGSIKDGEKVTHIFKFTNSGENPLVISNAQGSCGCTVPEWPKEAIAPGKTGEIKVIFDSAGKGSPEGSPQAKRVTLTANTDPVETYLNIKGVVVKEGDSK